MRYTPKGTAVTELGIAVNRIYTGENGEKREEVTFVDVTVWGRTAENVGEYLEGKGGPSLSKDACSSIPGKTNNPVKSATSSRSWRTMCSFSAPAAAAAVDRRRATKRLGRARAVERRTATPPKGSGPAEPDDDEIPF